MKILRSLLLFSSLSLTTATLSAQSFSAGDLIIYRTGNGTASLSGASAAVFLDDYSPSGTLIQSVALPTADGGGLNAVTEGGTAGTEGMLSLSGDGHSIIFSGYNTGIGTASVNSSSSATVQRVVGSMSSAGVISTTLLGTTAFSGTSIRSVYANNSSNIWAAGKGNSTTDGIWYTNNGSPTLVANTNLRIVSAAGGQLLAANGTSIQSIGTGMPVSGNVAPTTLFNVSGSTLNQFFLTDESNTIAGPDTLYVANSSANTSAILKFSLTSGTLASGTWVATGSASIAGISNTGAFGLTGVLEGNGSVAIYGTSSNTSNNVGELFGIMDSSGYDGALSGTATELALAAPNESFRGIAFAPTAVPEPGTTALLMGGGVAVVAVWRRRRKVVVPTAPVVEA